MSREDVQRTNETASFWKKNIIRENSTKAAPFAVTFDSKLTRLAKKIKELFKYLYVDLMANDVFTLTPMVSFLDAGEIRYHLVRAKPCSSVWNVGSRRFNKSRYEVYNNIESAGLFFSTVTGET